MKIKYLIGALAISVCSTMAACSDDDNDINPGKVPVAVREAFTDMFPGAKFVEWSKEAPYYVADFTYNAFDTDAWFGPDGDWEMTETDYNANIYNLPAAMQDTFLASEYANWTVDDVDLYERPEDTFCAIDIEAPGQEDLTVYIDSFGNVLNVTPDYDFDITPDTSIPSL